MAFARFCMKHRAVALILFCVLRKVAAAYIRAEAYIGLDEKEKAVEQLRYVVDYGNKLYYVQRARQQLERLGLVN